MVNVLRWLDDIAVGAARRTIDLGEGVLRRGSAASNEARLYNRHPLASASTANQRTFNERQVTHYNETLRGLLEDEQHSARFMTPRAADRLRKGGNDIFEVDASWGSLDPQHVRGGRSFVSMNADDAAAFRSDLKTTGPNRSSTFWDFVWGRNMRRIKPREEIETIMKEQNTLGIGNVRSPRGQSMNDMALAEVAAARRSQGIPTGPTGPPPRIRQGKMNNPVDPNMFFDDVSQGRVLGSRAAWTAAIGGTAILGGSVAHGRDMPGGGRPPSMFGGQSMGEGGQGMQGRRF